MGEISTRVWMDEGLWEKVRGIAIAEGLTIRELVPRLVGQALAKPPATAGRPAPAETPVVTAPLKAGPPVVELSEVYQCGLCGAEVKLSGLSTHIGKHLKERQSLEVERS